MLPCLYDEKQHEILSGGELLEWAKRVAPAKERDRFFLYRHRLHHTFVLARWATDRAMGIFTDFLHIGKSLANFNKEMADEFRRRLYAPTSAPEMAKAITQSQRDYTTHRVNEDGEYQDYAESRGVGVKNRLKFAGVKD